MEAASPQNMYVSPGPHERTLSLEDPGLPTWPTRPGAAGMRDLAKVRWKKDVLGLGALRVEIAYDDEANSLTRYRVEISDGETLAIYNVNARTLRPENEPMFILESDYSEVMPSERTRRFLSLDRHTERIDQLLADLGEHEQQFGHSRTLELLDALGFGKPRSLKGRGKLIDAEQLEALEAEHVSIRAIAQAMGVQVGAIYEHRRRLGLLGRARSHLNSDARLNRDKDEC
jgi:hypothetical protein